MEGKVEINVEDYNRLLEAQRLMAALDDAVVNHVLKKNEKLHLFRRQQGHNEDWRRASAFDSDWGTLYCITADKQRDELEEFYNEKVEEVNRLKYDLNKSRENEKSEKDQYLQGEVEHLREKVNGLKSTISECEMQIRKDEEMCREFQDQKAGLTMKISQLENELKDYHSSWLYKLKTMFAKMFGTK